MNRLDIKGRINATLTRVRAEIRKNEYMTANLLRVVLVVRYIMENEDGLKEVLFSEMWPDDVAVVACLGAGQKIPDVMEQCALCGWSAQRVWEAFARYAQPTVTARALVDFDTQHMLGGRFSKLEPPDSPLLTSHLLKRLAEKGEE